MATDENLDTELDIRRAEYHIKKRDVEHRERSGARAWRTTIIVPVIIASIAAMVNGGAIIYDSYITRDTQSELLRVSNLDDLFVREHRKIFSIIDLPEEERMSLICRWYRSNLFQHEDSIAVLNRSFSAEARCSADGFPIDKKYARELESGTAISLSNCRNVAAPVTASCKAYDKSGIHSRPSASCTIKLSAGRDRFFASSSVEVVSEFYRKRSGESAAQSIIGKADKQTGVIRVFSGRIACTNDKGTGRTCEARATVQAKSYPDSCIGLRDSLAAAS